MLRTKILVALVVATCACPSARAQTPFPGGSTTFSLGGSYTMPIHYSEGGISSVNATWGKFLWDNNSLSIDLGGHFAEQPYGNKDVIMGSAGVLARWHFANFDRWSIFFDGGGGVAYGENEFPTERYKGTRFNFYGKVGFGAAYELRTREYLTAGVRYFHHSNGQIHGKDQNPGYDGLQYWVGMMWTR